MFYDRFIELCTKKGVSPSTAAKEIGLSNSIITYWKRGATPKADTVQKIANYFSVSVDSLLGLKELRNMMDFFEKTIIANAENETSDNTHSHDETQILSSFHLLNELGRKKAIERVEELAEIPKYQASQKE